MTSWRRLGSASRAGRRAPHRCGPSPGRGAGGAPGSRNTLTILRWRRRHQSPPHAGAEATPTAHRKPPPTPPPSPLPEGGGHGLPPRESVDEGRARQPSEQYNDEQRGIAPGQQACSRLARDGIQPGRSTGAGGQARCSLRLQDGAGRWRRSRHATAGSAARTGWKPSHRRSTRRRPAAMAAAACHGCKCAPSWSMPRPARRRSPLTKARRHGLSMIRLAAMCRARPFQRLGDFDAHAPVLHRHQHDHRRRRRGARSSRVADAVGVGGDVFRRGGLTQQQHHLRALVPAPAPPAWFPGRLARRFQRARGVDHVRRQRRHWLQRLRRRRQGAGKLSTR